MTKLTKLAFSAALSVLMLGGMSSAAMAQEDITGKIIPSLEYEQADVREALRALFKAVGVSYSVAPEVQGTITVSLKNATFETALQTITRQVDATYRVESGIWQIVRREAEVTPGGPDVPEVTNKSNKVVRRIRIQHADPQFIAILMGGATGSQNFGIYPEMSTVYNTPRGGGGGNGGGGGFGSNGGSGGGFGSSGGSSFGGSSGGSFGGSSGGSRGGGSGFGG